MSDLERAAMEERLRDAERKLLEACDEIIALKANERALRERYIDADIQAKFWKRACEQALDSWNKLEDEHQALLARTAG